LEPRHGAGATPLGETTAAAGATPHNPVVHTRGLVAAAAALVVAVLGAILAIVYIPSGPSIRPAGAFIRFNDGYVGAHYVSWPAFSAQSSFKITSIDVKVDDPTRCTAVVRKVRRPAESFAAVTEGPIPGSSALGAVVSHASLLDYAVVLTPTQIGDCSVSSVTVGATSWAKTRTTTITSPFGVATRHASGVDSRVRDTPGLH
jgi:hypothetical protein